MGGSGSAEASDKQARGLLLDLDYIERILTSVVVEHPEKGPLELRFSHVVSTPRGNYAVFATFDENGDPISQVYKLVEVGDRDEWEHARSHWADMARALGEEGFVFLRRKD